MQRHERNTSPLKALVKTPAWPIGWKKERVVFDRNGKGFWEIKQQSTRNVKGTNTRPESRITERKNI